MVETKPDQYSLMGRPRPFLAYVAGNPQVRADGETEDEAVANLVYYVLSLTKGDSVKSAKVRQVDCDSELNVRAVMES